MQTFDYSKIDIEDPTISNSEFLRRFAERDRQWKRDRVAIHEAKIRIANGTARYLVTAN